MPNERAKPSSEISSRCIVTSEEIEFWRDENPPLLVIVRLTKRLLVG